LMRRTLIAAGDSAGSLLLGPGFVGVSSATRSSNDSGVAYLRSWRFAPFLRGHGDGPPPGVPLAPVQPTLPVEGADGTCTEVASGPICNFGAPESRFSAPKRPSGCCVPVPLGRSPCHGRATQS
jgi:hypothetical protein